MTRRPVGHRAAGRLAFGRRLRYAAALIRSAQTAEPSVLELKAARMRTARMARSGTVAGAAAAEPAEIAGRLREAIETGRRAPGDLLGTAADLAGASAAARAAVAAALARLTASGHVVKRGRYYVSDDPPRSSQPPPP